MNIQGLSHKKAQQIIQYIHGNTDEYIKTSQAENIYEEILIRIEKHATTRYAKNRIQILTPTNNLKTIKKNQNLIKKTLEETKNLDYNYIHKLFQNIKPLNNKITPRFDDSFAIVCEEYDDYLELLHNRYNHFTNIFPIEDHPNLNEYEYILYLYNEYNIEPPESPNIISLKNDADEYEILPDKILTYYEQNIETLKNVKKLREYLGFKTQIQEILDILQTLKKETTKPADITQIVDKIKTKADNKINEQIKNIALKGDEILQLLGNAEELPPKIKEIYDTTLNEAREELAESTGILFDPFIVEYPIKLDQAEIERVQKQTHANIQIKQYEEKIKACNKLANYKQIIQQETQEILHYNYPFALASFHKYYNLKIPKISNKYHFDDALHIRLKYEEKNDKIPMQPITYELDEKNNIVLLTGANSGGKTTLLEMLAQQNIMAHMGLGVCAQKATIAQSDEIYYFTKKQSLNAGAFETFLRSFIPAAVGDKKKLILIDELESITELEAAVKIIIGFIEQIQDKQNYAIIVTHMAPEILKQTTQQNIRVDGIEAKGLDENYNLIVDRNPKINYLAKSTPELILKRIYEKTEEPEKSIYKEILKKFKK